MGNSSSFTQQKQWIEYHQLSGVPGQPTLLSSSYDSTLQGQKYCLSAHLTQAQLQTYQSRRNPIENIVNVYDFNIKHQLPACVSMFTSLVVITQRIPYRLSMLKGLSKEEGFYVLKSAINGYKIIYKNNKACYPNDRMIGIMNNGTIKVWINQIWAKNSPETSINRQDRMVEELVNVVQDYVRRQQTTGFGNHFHEQRSKHQKTFVQLQKIVNHFIGDNLFQKIRQNKLRLKHRVKQLAQTKAGFLAKYISASDLANQVEKSVIINTNFLHNAEGQSYAIKVRSPVDNITNKYGQRAKSDRQHPIIRRIQQTTYLNQAQSFNRGKMSKSLPSQFCKFQDFKNTKPTNLSSPKIRRINVNASPSDPAFFHKNYQGQIRVNFIPNQSFSNSNTGIKFANIPQNEIVLRNRCLTQLQSKKKRNSINLKEHIDFGISSKVQQKIKSALKISINGHQYQKNQSSRRHRARQPVSSYLLKANVSNTVSPSNQILNTMIQNPRLYPTAPIYKITQKINQKQTKDGQAQTANRHVASRDLNFDGITKISQQSFGVGQSQDSLTQYYNQKNVQTGEKSIVNSQKNQKTEQKKPVKIQFSNYQRSDSDEQQKKELDDLQTPGKTSVVSQESLCLTASVGDQQPQATEKFTNIFKYYLQSYQGEKEQKYYSPSALDDQDLFKLQTQFTISDEEQTAGKVNKFDLPVIEQDSEMDY